MINPELILIFAANYSNMKYRRLSLDELKELEPEFVRFLASNSVTADDWTKIKEDSPKKAEQLIELFSDIVFDKILTPVVYMEQKTKHHLRIYKFLEDRIILMGLLIEDAPSFDFTKNNSPQEMIQAIEQSKGTIKTFAAEKKIANSKQMEAFALLESGALISKSSLLFDTIQSLQGA